MKKTERPVHYMPEPMSRAELEERLASAHSQTVYHAFIDAANYEEAAWVQSKALAALSSPDATIRNGALFALIFLTTARREIDLETAVPAITTMFDDPDPTVVAIAGGTLADIRWVFGQ
jgi:HEAT repeat protein